MKVTHEQYLLMKQIAKQNKEKIDISNFNKYASLIMIDEIADVIEKYECSLDQVYEILLLINSRILQMKIKKG